jgi:hypothetical protein
MGVGFRRALGVWVLFAKKKYLALSEISNLPVREPWLPPFCRTKRGIYTYTKVRNENSYVELAKIKPINSHRFCLPLNPIFQL